MNGRTLLGTTLLAMAAPVASTEARAAGAAEPAPAFAYLGAEPGGGIRVTVDRAGVVESAAQGDGRIVVPFPIAADETVDLGLERFRVTNDETRFVVTLPR